jgi:hypothetical protein
MGEQVMTEIKVKISGDTAQLMRWWFITCEPPYFYLRCRNCDRREFLPWDPRLRTQTAHEILVQHGRECVERQQLRAAS